MTLKISKTLISKEEIENKISEIAGEINDKYKGEELVVIGILKGAFIVVSDLAKQLELDVTFDFMSIKSCLLYTSPSPRDRQKSRMPSSA